MSSSRPAAVRFVAFVGDFPPRQCGIATFTHDIRNAVADRYPHTRCRVCAVNDPGESYAYPDAVQFEIEEQESASYLRAADFLNLSSTDVICVQHEFGIYGGASGAHLLEFARAVSAPIVSTLHTILEQPTPQQGRVLRELTSLSARVVVMSARARDILATTYDVPEDLIDLIPHGIPDMPFVDSSFYKDRIGVESKFVLLTFGLLSANKGIEHVIEALPKILEEFPDVVYVVLGATHPHVLRTEGEAYRRRLEKRVKELGLQQAVHFHNRFVEIEELKEFIAAADMYVTPYLNPAQIISGTLAYAFGCGKAVISTPYLHAVELLADDHGIIVPFADPDAISQAALGLLRDDLRRNNMRKRAYQLGREMIWSEVAARYMESFDKARRSRSTALPHPISDAQAIETGWAMPPIRLDHLRRMTDSTGLIQHARFTLPHYPEGYCTDDNARALALVVTLQSIERRALSVESQAADSTLSARCLTLTSTYASFLNAAFNPETGQFRNFMSYDRRWLDECGSDDSQGRSVLALGTCIAKTTDPDLRQWAAILFQSAVPAMLKTGSPRAWAQALLGIDAYLVVLSGDRSMRRIADQLEKRLIICFNAAKSSGWPWFETVLTYDNAVLAHALILRGREDRVTLNIGLHALRWLAAQQTAPTGHFRPIGSDGFYPHCGERAQFDQQPIEAAGMVSASLAAFEATRDAFWLEQARLAFEWFHGRNDIGMALYDPLTGGCRDGLRVDRVNMNQGAESTVAYLNARALMDTVERRQLPAAAAYGAAAVVESAHSNGVAAVISKRRAPSGVRLAS